MLWKPCLSYEYATIVQISINEKALQISIDYQISEARKPNFKMTKHKSV